MAGRKGNSSIEIEPLQRKTPLTVSGALGITDSNRVSGLLNTDEKDNSQETINHEEIIRSLFPSNYAPAQALAGYPPYFDLGKYSSIRPESP